MMAIAQTSPSSSSTPEIRCSGESGFENIHSEFRQGGINPGETPEQAMFRERQEEVGRMPQHVKILGRTRDWLRYEVPHIGCGVNGGVLRRTEADLVSDPAGRARHGRESARLRSSGFDAWRWHDYWIPLDSVIEFRAMYKNALTELSRFLQRGAYPRGSGCSASSTASRRRAIPAAPIPRTDFRRRSRLRALPAVAGGRAS
ncbi:MAG: NUDIX domain-containing protein [Betaproteobacteria bacterium]|nr:NUDIX domain-containing protein [Betaproteobacteria bacterium]